MVRFPPFIRSEHYEGIGRVVVAWAILESSMLITLQAMLGTTKPKAMVTFWHAAYNDRRDRILSLAKLLRLNQRTEKRLIRLLESMNAAVGVRNTVAHSRWDKSPRRNAITPFIVRARGDLKVSGIDFEERHYTPAKLNREAIKIIRLANEFRTFSMKVFGARFGKGTGDSTD